MRSTKVGVLSVVVALGTLLPASASADPPPYDRERISGDASADPATGAVAATASSGDSERPLLSDLLGSRDKSAGRANLGRTVSVTDTGVYQLSVALEQISAAASATGDATSSARVEIGYTLESDSSFQGGNHQGRELASSGTTQPPPESDVASIEIVIQQPSELVIYGGLVVWTDAGPGGSASATASAVVADLSANRVRGLGIHTYLVTDGSVVGKHPSSGVLTGVGAFLFEDGGSPLPGRRVDFIATLGICVNSCESEVLCSASTGTDGFASCGGLEASKRAVTFSGGRFLAFFAGDETHARGYRFGSAISENALPAPPSAG